MKKGLLIVFILIQEICLAQPTIQWEKCYGGTGIDEGKVILQTNDGGYIVGGFSNSTDGNITNSHGGIWLIKLNSFGSLQWQKTYGGSCYCEVVNSIIQTIDGGYLFAGQTGSTNGDVSANHGFNGSDAWVVKLNDTGDIQWAKCYGGTDDDEIESVIQTNDGGYIFTGSTKSNDGDVIGNHGYYDMWVVKLDGTGSIQWAKCYGGSDKECGNSIKSKNEGGYIIAGVTTSNDGDVSMNHGDNDVWLVKIDSIGYLLWQKCYGGSGIENPLSLINTIDGGYAIGAFTASNDGDVSGFHGGLGDYWLLKLNGIGTIQWQQCYGGSDEDEISSIIQTQEGGYALGGWSNSTNGDVTGNHGCDFWIVKTDTFGAIQWQKCYGGNGCEYGYSMIQALDGGLVITGPTSTSNNGDVTGFHGGPWDYWVVKLNPYNVGIEEVNKEGGISLFPSPNNGTFTLQYNLSAAGSLRVTDVLGREVYAYSLLNRSGQETITLPLSQGIYFWQVLQEHSVSAKGKLVIIK